MDRGMIKEYSEGTAYFRQMKDEFEEIAAAGSLISTKSLLMDGRQEINKKLNQALKIWKSSSPSRYVIDYIFTVINFTFSKGIRAKLYRETGDYKAGKKLSADSDAALLAISNGLTEYTLKMLQSEAGGDELKKYKNILKKYLDAGSLKNAILEPDERFIIDFLAPVTEMPLEKIDYFLSHVLRRKSLDFYDRDEFLLYAVTLIGCDFEFGFLCELKSYYEELKKSGESYKAEDFDDSMTVFAGYYADDEFISRLEDEDDIAISNIRDNETVKNMLLWHISLKKTKPSSAYTRFAELYDNVNELYAEEIADFIVFKKNDKVQDADETDAKGKRGEYNISNKYDGSGEITIKYAAEKNVVIEAGKKAFVSNGRFNRINGTNYFAPCEDITLNKGEGVLTVRVKCVSENPFQMAKTRKNGTAEIAGRDTIELSDEYKDGIVRLECENKPVCIYFNMLKNTGTIYDYLYSGLDRKDMLDEWFYDKISMDAGLLNVPWFIETKLSTDPAADFEKMDEGTQRNWILLLLFMKYVKEHKSADETVRSINKNFVQTVQYEMGELRFDGVSYGNPFDCLLSYLLLSDTPVDNLRLLYKEVDKIQNENK